MSRGGYDLAGRRNSHAPVEVGAGMRQQPPGVPCLASVLPRSWELRKLRSSNSIFHRHAYTHGHMYSYIHMPIAYIHTPTHKKPHTRTNWLTAADLQLDHTLN